MKTKKIFMRIIDIAMIVILLLLMAFQVTKQMPHEWFGISVVVLLIVHHILNYKYYKSIFKGKYSPIRILQLAVNIFLLVSILITPISGMMMSRYATPFMNGLMSSMLVRELHLAFSYWSFVLMSMHIGLHFGIITNKLPKGKFRMISGGIISVIAVYGFKLFIDANIFSYMLWQSHFAFLDYDKVWWLVILENLAMLISWAWIVYMLSMALKSIPSKKHKTGSKKWLAVYFITIIAVIGLGMGCHFIFAKSDSNSYSSWSTVSKPSETSQTVQTSDTYNEENSSASAQVNTKLTDHFIRIKGGCRLPTEAEWEYACHSRTNTPFNSLFLVY